MGLSKVEYYNGLPFLLQGIFLTQRSNLCLLHWQQILYNWASRESSLFVLTVWIVSSPLLALKTISILMVSKLMNTSLINISPLNFQLRLPVNTSTWTTNEALYKTGTAELYSLVLWSCLIHQYSIYPSLVYVYFLFTYDVNFMSMRTLAFFTALCPPPRIMPAI